MSTYDEALQTIIDAIVKVDASGLGPGGKATAYLKLAEAYAWLVRPDNPHGGTTSAG